LESVVFENIFEDFIIFLLSNQEFPFTTSSNKCPALIAKGVANEVCECWGWAV
jgi:hypothetical protein